MKRIHLFEFEDQGWFPNWLRNCMTRLIIVVHKMFGTEETIVESIKDLRKEDNFDVISDLCSGSGGPMPGVVERLNRDSDHPISLTLTDLYPNLEYENKREFIEYSEEPLDALNGIKNLPGLKTMICSFHHMTPKVAKAILTRATESRQPLYIFELSDNSAPKWLWWTAIPINIIMCLILTFKVRPLPFHQVVFTFLIPIIPIFYAWDGAVSNIRTYTPEDIQHLLKDQSTKNYSWEIKKVGNRIKNLIVIGRPI